MNENLTVSLLVLFLLGSLIVGFGTAFRADPSAGFDVVVAGTMVFAILLSAVVTIKSPTIRDPSKVNNRLLVLGIIFSFSMMWFLITMRGDHTRLPTLGAAIASLCSIILIARASKVPRKCALCGVPLERAKARVHDPKRGLLCAACWAEQSGAAAE